MRIYATIAAAAALSLSLTTTICDARKFVTLHVTVKNAPLPLTRSNDDARCVGVGNPWTALTDQCLCAPCDLCEYSFTAGECRWITPKVESDSDGTDTPMQQPELAAEKWFLTEEEMTASRNGVERTALYLWTPSNNVTTFAGTNEYFDAVYGDLEATASPDLAYITGWSFDDVTLRPEIEDDAERNATKVVTVLQRLVDKGVDLHIIGWTNFFETAQNIAFAKQVNAITPPPKQGTAYFLFDDRLPDALASHHQKTVAIKRATGIVAYVGGIDLTWDRWDTIAHNVSDVRTRANIERDGKTHGWMDAHMKVDGPAASDIAHNFLERWNMKRKPLQDFFDPLFSYENSNYSSLPDLTTGEPLVENKKAGTHAVQVVRTYSCKYDHYEEVAPRGELSLFHARIKAIKLAKNYVYIEDQYFIHVPQLMDALLEVLPHLQRVVIATQPAFSDTRRTGYDKYQWQMLQPLLDTYPNKVQVFRTKPERGIYIHSKLVIVDDVFLSISSSNWNRRSMTTDTEIGASVVDSESVTTPDGVRVNRLARDYRVRKFMELTGKSYDEIDSMGLRAACDALDTAADDPTTILEHHQPREEASFVLYTDAVRAVADPLALCKADR